MSLREEYQRWCDNAPPKPFSGQRPTTQQLDQLRNHGIGKKNWLANLSEQDRAQVHVWEAEAISRRKEHSKRNNILAASSASSLVAKKEVKGKDGTMRVCRHWARTGGQCLYGKECKFLHPSELVCRNGNNGNESGNDNSNSSSAPICGGLTAAAKASNPIHTRTRPNRTNDNRMGSFRRFLLDTYGEDRLKAGSGVVEVSAGIHGGISFELVNLNGIQSTAIEPRGPLRLKKRRRMLQNGIYHRTKPLQRYNSIDLDGVLSARNRGGVIGLAPRHWRVFFGQWMVASSETEMSSSFDGQLSISVRRAAALRGATATASGHEEEYCSECQDIDDTSFDDKGDDNIVEEEKSDTSVDLGVDPTRQQLNTNHDADEQQEQEQQQVPPDASEICSIIKNASILIGLHPDQPTGDIVDAALSLSKPFAVAPCCVFPKQFSDRILPCGTPVRTYEQFLDWIRAKDGRIRTFDLGFGGRSIILYFDPRWKTLGRQDDTSYNLGGC